MTTDSPAQQTEIQQITNLADLSRPALMDGAECSRLNPVLERRALEIVI
jgi:hypothetical protein